MWDGEKRNKEVNKSKSNLTGTKNANILELRSQINSTPYT